MEPNYLTETNKSTPAEVAAREGHTNVVAVLSEFTTIPNLVKLCLMIITEKDGKTSEEFETLLKITAVDEVKIRLCVYLTPRLPLSL